jgi:hypothetical protein
MTILETLPPIEGNSYLFPGARQGRPLSNMALLQIMRGLGYAVDGNRGECVPHGFRSRFLVGNLQWPGLTAYIPQPPDNRRIGQFLLQHLLFPGSKIRPELAVLLEKKVFAYSGAFGWF